MKREKTMVPPQESPAKRWRSVVGTHDDEPIHEALAERDHKGYSRGKLMWLSS